MRKMFLTLAACALVCLFSASASATANFVEHKQSGDYVATPTCPSGDTDTGCGKYVENTDRGAAAGFQVYSPEAYTLRFKIEFHNSTDQARVYYTTDGSKPCGSLGAVGNVTQPNGTPCGTSNTTQAVVASYTCTYSDSNSGCQEVDVATASIPPQPAGTVVNYIVSAWQSESKVEIFGNSGACDNCQSFTSSSQATQFSYGVLAPPPTPLIISEFRLRGPNGPNDEFVEIYNNSDAEVVVQTFDGSDGFALAASDGLARFVIRNGTRISARGHYLGTNSAYSYGTYPSSRPAGGGAAASAQQGTTATQRTPAQRTSVSDAKGSRSAGIVQAAEPSADAPLVSSTTAGDVTYALDISDNAGIALFKSSRQENFTKAYRLDAAGSTSEFNDVYKEGVGYPAIVPSTDSYSFYRSLCSFVAGVGCTTPGRPKDTGDNAADFLYVSTNGIDRGAGKRLGAPGPENSASPVERNAQFFVNLLDRTEDRSGPPNRERNFTSDPTNHSSLGTLSIRRRVTNNTGHDVTRLRFRIVEITTFPATAGVAELRARDSSPELVQDVGDQQTCGLLLQPCTVAVQGTTLEQASAPNDQPNGGGFNSSLTLTLATPLAQGDSVNVKFTLGVERAGAFRFLVNVEALP